MLGTWVFRTDDKFEYFNLETYIATSAFIFVGKEHLLLFPIHHRLTLLQNIIRIINSWKTKIVKDKDL